MSTGDTPVGRAPQAATVILHGRRLLLARAALAVVAVLVVGLFIRAVPLQFMYVQVVCPGRACQGQQLTPDGVRQLQALGISRSAYATYVVALDAMFAAAYCAIAAIIVWRKSDERMALFSALVLVTFGCATFPGTFEVLTITSPLWQWPALGLEFLGSAAIIPYFYAFPGGRFVPRWSRWLAGAWILAQVPLYLPDSPGKHATSFLFLPVQAVLFAGILSAAVAQIYRYRRVSSPLQRQQTKVVVFGTAAALGGYLALVLGSALLQPFLRASALGALIVSAATYAVMLLIPLSIGVAILRYRLWDVDLLINKVLVYGALTATLGALYIGSVVGLIALLRGLTGERSTVAIVIATLVIVALFQPLRHRIQSGIDRRFYRRKYDAAQALAAFSARLRDEVDLNAVTADLVAVIDDTVQPEHVALWLREPERHA